MTNEERVRVDAEKFRKTDGSLPLLALRAIAYAHMKDNSVWLKTVGINRTHPIEGSRDRQEYVFQLECTDPVFTKKYTGEEYDPEEPSLIAHARIDNTGKILDHFDTGSANYGAF